MAQNGRPPVGRAYRAYRFPHHGGRLSRRPGATAAGIGGLATALGIVVAGLALFAGSAAASVWSFFSADLPAAHDLETAPVRSRRSSTTAAASTSSTDSRTSGASS